MDFYGTYSNSLWTMKAINTPSISDFEFIHNSKVFTISAWFNLDSLTTPIKKTIIQNTYTASAAAGGGSGFNLWIDNRSSAKKIRFNLDDQSSPTSIDYTYSSMATGKWVNVVVTGGGPGGNNCKMFINGGSAVASATLGSATSVNSSHSAIIGSRVDSDGDSYFNGQLSNIAIWNSDQSANIADIYNNGSPQTSYTVTPQNWWKLNADSVYTPSAPNYTKALNFDGANNLDNISLGNLSSILSADFTISIWVYFTDTSRRSAVLFSSGTDYTNSIIFQLTNTGFHLTAGGTGVNIAFPGNSGYYIKSDKWYHCVYTVNGTTGKAYVDGLQMGNDQSMGSTRPGTEGQGAIITNYAFSTNAIYALKGNVSNAAIFNSALTASQISTLFNFGTPETNISFNPQAWWKLDDQNAITDSSNNGNTGTNNGATNISLGVAVTPSWKIPSALPITTTPNYTTALDFNGTSQITTSYTPPTGANARTISLWFYQDTSGNADICGYGTNSVTGLFDIILYGGDVYVHGFGTNQEYGRGAYTVGAWNHYVVTYDGTKVKGYVNNVATPENTVTLSTGTSNTFKIGNGYYNVGNFNGKISNVSTWNTALTSTQVSTLFNGGTPETAISFSPVSWWKLDTGGSTITDYGSGGNNGTNNGPATQVTSDVLTPQPVNGVSTTLQQSDLQQSDLQFDSPYSNYSLSFDGTNSINCGNIGFYSPKVTFSCWIKPNGDGRFIKYGDSSSNGLLWASCYTNGNLIIYVRNANRTFASSIVQNQWQHVLITRTSYNVGKVYVNGVFKGDLIGTASDLAQNGTLEIGDGSFSKKIDEFAVWNTDLTEAQVLEIYNSGRPKDLSTFSGTAPTNWWRLGENAYFDNNAITVPNSISGAPNGVGPGTVVNMLSADAPGTYANGIGTNLDILDRVGDAALSTSNSQSYNMIPSDISPYVPQYVGNQIANNFSMTFDSASNTSFNAGNTSVLSFERTNPFTISAWIKTNATSTQVILNKLISNVGYQFFINSTGKLCFYSQQSSSVYIQKNSTAAFNNNSWQHVVVTYDGSSNRSGILLYANGNATATTDVGSASLNATIINTASVNIGSSFTGQIDEVAIFDTVLNAGQIYNDIYQPTATGTNQTADLVNNPNLPNPVAWYRMGD